MGIGVIGTTGTGAVEPLPFGASALLTSGFVNGLSYDYTASVAPGRYIIQGSTQDGDSPIVAYAPNSNTTAIAFPGKSAILNVTSAETVIKLSAMPVVGSVGVTNRTGHWTANGVAYYRNQAAAENTAGTTIVDSVIYYTGSSWYGEIHTSTDSGATWQITFSVSSVSNDPRPIEFIPNNGGYFLMCQNNNTYRSVDGVTWNQVGNYGTVNDFVHVAGSEVLMASNNGIYRSTNDGQNWTQVLGTTGCQSIAKLDGHGVYLGYNATNVMYSSDRINWTRVGSYSYANTQNVAFTSYYGIVGLKNHAVVGNYVWPSSSFAGGGFTLFDRQGAPIATTWQGDLAYRQSTDVAGPEWQYVVKMPENRGYVLSIAIFSGDLSLSTDGYSWQKIGKVAGMTNGISGGNTQHQGPKIQSNKMIVSTYMTGGPAKYTNAFAYKIYASAI